MSQDQVKKPRASLGSSEGEDIFGTFDAASLEIVTGIASKGISLENSPAPISPAKIESVSVG